MSRALPVLSGTPVVAGPSRSTIAVSAAAAFAVGAVAMASVVQFHDPGAPRPRSCNTAVQLVLPASMLMLLFAACAASCFDKLTSIRARPQAERRRSRATRFTRGDTQPTHRNTTSDFSMFSSSRQTDFCTAESTLSARRRDHERQIWRCISSFAPIWILLLFIFKWMGAVVVEVAAHLIGHRTRTMLPGCDRSSDWTDELDPGIGGSCIHRAAWLGPISRITAPIASSVGRCSRRTLVSAGTSLLEASYRTPSENLASVISPVSSLSHSAAVASRAPARAMRSITRALSPAEPPPSPRKRVRRGGTGRKRPERARAPLTVSTGVSLPQIHDRLHFPVCQRHNKLGK